MPIFRSVETQIVEPDHRPLGIRLAEVQYHIHGQKLEIADARNRLLNPDSTVSEYDKAVFDLDFAHDTLDILRGTCVALQHRLGQNRKGQPLPDHIVTVNE